MTPPVPVSWSVEHLAEVLADAPLLSGFSAAECAALARRLRAQRFAVGEVVVAQGATGEHAMYFCLQGKAAVRRNGVEVQRLGAAEHFGELSLVNRTPRAASVHAVTELDLGELSQDQYQALWAEDAGLARRLLEAIARGIAGRLTDVTDGMGVLLRQHTLPRRTTMQVNVDGKALTVHPGVAVHTLLPAEIDGHTVVAGLVNRTPVSLASTLGSSCTLLPLTTAHWEGQRVYRTSLGLLLLEAARRLEPKLRVRLRQSVGFAQRVEVSDGSALDVLGPALEAKMRELVDAGATLSEELWAASEAAELFRERGDDDGVALLRTWREPAVPLVTYGAVHALGLLPLVSDVSRLRDFGIERDEGGLLLLYGARSPSQRPSPRASVVPSGPSLALQARAVSKQTRAMTLDQQRFLQALSVTSVGAFNRTCVDGKVTELIRVHEGFHEKAIGQIADAIAAQRDTLKIVCVAGPSSSGKTTFIRRLRVQLQVNGIVPVGLSLDDYYVDRARTPRDEQGEYDYEALEALDLPLLTEQLSRLLVGESVKVARYEFRTGQSLPQGGAELQLGPEHMLLVEGIHGLNPAIVSGVLPERVFRIFICPLTQLPFDALHSGHASDLRLLRRIVRDRHGRATAAEQNILRWPSVRAGERRHIFPFQQHADAVFDSSLVYEHAVLKVYAERYLLEVPHDSAAFTTAYRLLRLLDRFVTIYPDQVPPTSMLREFIGGSGFEY